MLALKLLDQKVDMRVIVMLRKLLVWWEEKICLHICHNIVITQQEIILGGKKRLKNMCLQAQIIRVKKQIKVKMFNLG